MPDQNIHPDNYNGIKSMIIQVIDIFGNKYPLRAETIMIDPLKCNFSLTGIYRRIRKTNLKLLRYILYNSIQLK